MSDLPPGLVLPQGLDEIDAAFMTKVLRASGLIAPTNEVVSQEETGVGMTAGYFSTIKKIKCTYKQPTDAQDSFVVKAWPAFELRSKDAIRQMFIKDIMSYHLPRADFFPRPKAYLAAFDAANDRWALVMEDADSFAEHKVHENELTLDEVMTMIPAMVDVAVAWEGCDCGEKARRLDALRVEHWASNANLAVFKAQMPGGAKFLDKVTTMANSSLVGPITWDTYLGGPGISEMFTTRLDDFFRNSRLEHGATCTLAHGDFRGDNLFFCDDHPDYPGGWLCIDFQLMFRGPVPSDLAYLMGSGSVLPEVYTGLNRQLVLSEFYRRFVATTRLYKAYTYEQFAAEYEMMSTVLYLYFVANAAPIFQQGAFHNAMCMRVEFGGQGATEADLSPEERRQRMWWRKAWANFRENLKTFDQYRLLQSLPENLVGLGAWVELPDHLR
jgi:Ecdysteroid kinase-like family